MPPPTPLPPQNNRDNHNDDSFKPQDPGKNPHEDSNKPDWKKIAAGSLLLVMDLAIDFLLIAGIVAIPEFEVTMIVDAIATGIPLGWALVYLHYEAGKLIYAGITGQ
jgi:hypothetical protein